MKAEKTDRKEQVQELTKKLEDGITALFESDRYLEYLTIMARFHHYSYRNTLLILLQCPDATLVAGFHAWKQKFGRHVKKGETGICILAPMAYKYKKESKKQDQEVVILEPESEDTKHTKKAEQSEELEEKSEQRIVGFRVVRVFDVTQTEGKELPQLGVTVMVTLCCFAGTVIFFLLPYLQFHTWDETGNMLSGKAAVLYRKEIYIHTLSGVLTEERVTQDINEYQKAASDMQDGVLAKRIYELKESEEGVTHMCKVLEEIREEGRMEDKMETANNLYKMGMPLEQIAQAVQVSVQMIQEWLSGETSPVK